MNETSVDGTALSKKPVQRATKGLTYLIAFAVLAFGPYRSMTQTAPAVTGTLAGGARIVNGTGQAVDGNNYTAVSIYVCINSTATSAPAASDCSSSPSVLTNGNSNAVTIDANGVFSATLKDAVAAGAYVWLTQVATPKTGVAVKSYGTVFKVTSAPSTVTIVQPLREGAGIISGTATASTSATTTNVQLLINRAGGDGTFTPQGGPIAVDSSGTYTTFATLNAGDQIQIQQIGGGISNTVTVQASANQREHIDFIAGTVISQSQSNFSQANTFLAANFDREWKRTKAICVADKVSSCTHSPGINTYFQARLTTIPVSSSSTTTTTTTSGSTTPSTPQSLSSELTSQQTGHFEAGVYFPMTMSLAPVVPGNSPKTQTFYLAPIFRFGYDTLATSGNSTSTSTSTGTTTTTPTQLGTNTPLPSIYNFAVGGMRFGTGRIEPGGMKNIHYLDITVGKFSNLENLLCPPAKAPCIGTTNELRYRPWRMSFEGYFELPDTGFIVGMSANVGSNFLDNHKGTDPNNRAASDLRFLFAYRFDMNKLIQNLPMLK